MNLMAVRVVGRRNPRFGISVERLHELEARTSKHFETNSWGVKHYGSATRLRPESHEVPHPFRMSVALNALLICTVAAFKGRAWSPEHSVQPTTVS